MYLKKLPFLALIFAIFFNLFLLRSELTIKSDPNDNIFQFALVNRTNIIWQEYGCPWQLSCLARLFDHWTPEWAEGYPLPFYYSHLPQIAIVSSYHFINWLLGLLGYRVIDLFWYYHVITYLMLSFFPLSVFWALRIMDFPPLVQIFGALFASHLSTDGLYGMDNSSYLWRGYGLTSQLFATFFLPLAVAYAFRAMSDVSTNFKSQTTQTPQLKNPKSQVLYRDVGGLGIWNLKFGNLGKAILFLTLTLLSHLGLGYMALVSLFPFLFITFRAKEIIARVKRLAVIAGITLALLSYWIVPFWRQKIFHNISVWDPLWKFNSFGYFDVLTRFLEGELIDFGRFPMLTILTVVGFFVLFKNNRTNGTNKTFRTNKTYKVNTWSLTNPSSLFPIALLFPFWLFLFFGRTTWGPLMKFLPGAESFHLHRFLNGLHLSVLFLAPVGAAWTVQKVLALSINLRKFTQDDTVLKVFQFLIFNFALLIFVVPTYRQTISYARPNDEWLATANQRFASDWSDFKRLIATLRQLPSGRIYAGKPGYWGKDFKIGDTQVYMALSVRGFEVSQFLPETWSPNSDTEQFFDERVKHYYDLYNIRYVVAPQDVKLPDFVNRKERFGKFLLYEIETSGYFTVGKSNLTVLANRTNYHNLIHLWQISPLVENRLYPVITFKNSKLPKVPQFTHTITMADSTTYVPAGASTNVGRRNGHQETSIFAQSPFFIPENYATPSAAFSKEKVKAGQEYSTEVSIPKKCQDCLVVAKITYHPNWQVLVDGKQTEKMIVLPFYIGVPVNYGTHTITVRYQPSRLKLALFTLTAIVLIVPLFIRNNQPPVLVR